MSRRSRPARSSRPGAPTVTPPCAIPAPKIWNQAESGARLQVADSIEGLNLKEFFLLLSSTGLAYRRCELVRVNGTEMDVSFLKGKNAKKRQGKAANKDAVMA